MSKMESASCRELRKKPPAKSIHRWLSWPSQHKHRDDGLRRRGQPRDPHRAVPRPQRDAFLRREVDHAAPRVPAELRPVSSCTASGAATSAATTATAAAIAAATTTTTASAASAAVSTAAATAATVASTASAATAAASVAAAATAVSVAAAAAQLAVHHSDPHGAGLRLYHNAPAWHHRGLRAHRAAQAVC